MGTVDWSGEVLLAPGELVLASGWAEVPMPRQGLLTMAPIATIIEVGYLVINKGRAAKLRRQSAEAGFPLDRHMRVVVTSDRVLTWTASRLPRRRKGFLGEIPRAEVAEVSEPYSSFGGSTTVVFRMRNGYRIRFRVDRSVAAALTRPVAP